MDNNNINIKIYSNNFILIYSFIIIIAQIFNLNLFIGFSCHSSFFSQKIRFFCVFSIIRLYENIKLTFDIVYFLGEGVDLFN